MGKIFCFSCYHMCRTAIGWLLLYILCNFYFLETIKNKSWNILFQYHFLGIVSQLNPGGNWVVDFAVGIVEVRGVVDAVLIAVVNVWIPAVVVAVVDLVVVVIVVWVVVSGVVFLFCVRWKWGPLCVWWLRCPLCIWPWWWRCIGQYNKGLNKLPNPMNGL